MPPREGVARSRAADVAQIAPHALVAAREGWGQTARVLIRGQS